MATANPIVATTAAATGTDMVVAGGSSGKVTAFATGGITSDFQVAINEKVSDGSYQPYVPYCSEGQNAPMVLNMRGRAALLLAPGTYQAVKGVTTQAVGVTFES